MEVKAIHTLWPEKEDFILERNKCEDFYVFIHFLTKARLYDGSIIHEGGCILYAPYSYRYFKAEGGELCHDWMHIGGDLSDIIEKYGIEFNRIYYPSTRHDITNIISEIDIENKKNSKFKDELCRLKLEELFIKMSREATVELSCKIDEYTYNLFTETRNMFRADYNKIRTVEPFAAKTGLSVSRFYVLYRKLFGISPKQDLLNIRTDHAKQLLLQNVYTIYEIAEMVGYTNPYHFSRQFKACTGTSPSKYVKLHNVKHILK